MGYAVYHVEKGKANANAIGHHIDRTEGKEHSYRQADPERKGKNVHYKIGGRDLPKIPLQEAVNTRIKEGYTGKKAIRKDAVRYLKHVVSGSHKDMKEMEKDPKKIEKWVQANFKFMAKEFGQENIVRFSLHLDEKTPHIHCVTVPLTEDGRLSAKKVLGGRKEMSDRQTRYAEQMAQFGLERGLKRTGIKHEDARAFYARVNNGINAIKQGIDEILPEGDIQRGPKFPVTIKMEKATTMDVLSSKRWEKYEERVRSGLEKSLNDRINKTESEMVEQYNSKLKTAINRIDKTVGNKRKSEQVAIIWKAKAYELHKALYPEQYEKKKQKKKGKGQSMERAITPKGWNKFMP